MQEATSDVAPVLSESQLSQAQRDLLDEWLPDRELLGDHSWGQVGTFVLEVQAGDKHVIVKAADQRDYHLPREIRAHREWLGPWTRDHRAPQLLHVNEAERIIVTEYLPGRLVQGDPAEHEPDTYRQAGELLSRLHAQSEITDPHYGDTLRIQTLATLVRPHRLKPTVASQLRELVQQWTPGPAALVPTHGDWQPRNWLIDDGVINAIDFGRAAQRPPATDLLRLASRHFIARPDLEAAFISGYGSDPRIADPDAWFREQLAVAIGIATWAYGVGDEEYEFEGHRAIGELLQ